MSPKVLFEVCIFKLIDFIEFDKVEKNLKAKYVSKLFKSIKVHVYLPYLLSVNNIYLKL